MNKIIVLYLNCFRGGIGSVVDSIRKKYRFCYFLEKRMIKIGDYYFDLHQEKLLLFDKDKRRKKILFDMDENKETISILHNNR